MRVLFTILNWGLGHATRSSPIIDAVIERGDNAVIASSGLALAYLKKRFPKLNFLDLPDKEVSYGKHGAGLSLLKRASQQSDINKMQHAWVKEQVNAHQITHIISDNVYGAYADIPSVIITHQMGLTAPLGQSIINQILAGWLDKFDSVWIPDIEGELSLAGKLLINDAYLREKQFIGHLGRFESDISVKKDIPNLAILSGPEPQRQIFEDRIKQAFKDKPTEVVIVRGTDIPSGEQFGIKTFDLLDEKELQGLVNRAQHIICRSGYSSLMDFASLGKDLTLVPTPQQPEQQYLAKRAEEKNWFGTCSQKDLNFEGGRNNYPTSADSEHGIQNDLRQFLGT